jgi:hypothetical protein
MTQPKQDKASEVSYTLIAQALKIEGAEVSALACGIDDGFEQGLELTSGMSYDSVEAQWAYDVGTYIGFCLKVRRVKMIDRDAVITGLASHIIDGMDMDALMCYAYEQMTSYLCHLTDSELLDEASNADFDVPVEPEND